jgi:hypothetical protein
MDLNRGTYWLYRAWLRARCEDPWFWVFWGVITAGIAAIALTVFAVSGSHS